jgi:hypothetical protein
MLDDRETCDGDCPASCADASECTVDVMIGAAATCNVECLHQTISQCRNGDGCCPAGCVNATDDDCSATCNNGMLDTGETCDGDCPTSCATETACMTGTLIGSAANCSAECRYQMITACTPGDGCCPSACTEPSDSDCTPQPPLAMVGSPCTSAQVCGTLSPNAASVCFSDGFPGGYCTFFCTSEPCPSGSTCDINFMCIDNCANTGECRTNEGYTCMPLFDRTEQTFMGCKAP